MRRLILVLIASTSAGAQSPPIRSLPAPHAVSTLTFDFPTRIRELPNGRILVNDLGRRQLILFDSSLKVVAIVADSIPGAENYYGPYPAGLIPYVGDSSLFVDQSAVTMLIIDPNGKIARVASVPRAKDIGSLGDDIHTGTDAKGRLLYRAPPTFLGGFTPSGGGMRSAGGGGGGGRASGGIPPGVPVSKDSDAVLRIDVSSRRLDTAGMFRIRNDHFRLEKTSEGYRVRSELSPIHMVDEFTVLSDGALAIVRGADYHVDFIGADGALFSGPKIPYNWRRLSDEEKGTIVDTARKSWTEFFKNDPDGPRPDWVSPSKLPDYFPAFNQNAVTGDRDGNVWVRTNAKRSGGTGTLYDVINRKGKLIDRIEVPPKRQVLGFGKGGVVYFITSDEGGRRLERTRR
jgi:hypothetical protein